MIYITHIGNLYGEIYFNCRLFKNKLKKEKQKQNLIIAYLQKLNNKQFNMHVSINFK